MGNKEIKIISQHSDEELYSFFLQFYDYDFWIHKTRILQLVIEHSDKLDYIFQDEVLKKYPKDKIIKQLKFELYFSHFHSIESLFALIFAFIINPKNPWLWITEYTHKDFNTLIDKVKEQGMGSLVKEDETHLLKYLFYPVDLEKNLKEKEVNESISFIGKYLKRLAYEYQDREDYNSYKHGFRALNVNAIFKLTPEHNPEKSLDSHSESSVYLGTKILKRNKDYKEIKITEVTKAFDYSKAIDVTIINTRLIQNLIRFKVAELKKEKKVEANLFNDKEVGDIFNQKKGGFFITKFEM